MKINKKQYCKGIKPIAPGVACTSLFVTIAFGHLF
jgi:hypothetical protein